MNPAHYPMPAMLKADDAVQFIAGPFEAAFPDAGTTAIRRAALACLHQVGQRTERVALARNVADAACKGVERELWVRELPAVLDLVLTTLVHLSRRGCSQLEEATILRILAEGHAPAVGVEIGPGEVFPWPPQ